MKSLAKDAEGKAPIVAQQAQLAAKVNALRRHRHRHHCYCSQFECRERHLATVAWGRHLQISQYQSALVSPECTARSLQNCCPGGTLQAQLLTLPVGAATCGAAPTACLRACAHRATRHRRRPPLTRPATGCSWRWGLPALGAPWWCSPRPGAAQGATAPLPPPPQVPYPPWTRSSQSPHSVLPGVPGRRPARAGTWGVSCAITMYFVTS